MKLRTVRVRNLIRPKEIENACQLLNKYVGGLHRSQDYDNDTSLILSLRNNEFGLIGAGTFMILDDQLDGFDSYYLDWLWNDGDRCEYCDEPIVVGYIESIAVIPELQGLGLGKILVERGLKFLESKGCTEVVAMCWLSGLKGQSLPLFEHLGFEEVEHFIQPWEGIPCVVCGDDCKCDATMVHKVI